MENKEEEKKVRPKQPKQPKPIFEEIPLTEEELKEKKMHLEQCKIQKDDSDIELEMLLDQLDKKIPTRFLDDDIASYEKQIKEKVNDEGKDLTEADLDYMRIHLKSLKKKKKLDTEVRKLRLKIEGLRYQKSRIDAPEQQIKKLEREIRTKKQTVMSIPERPAAYVN